MLFIYDWTCHLDLTEYLKYNLAQINGFWMGIFTVEGLNYSPCDLTFTKGDTGYEDGWVYINLERTLGPFKPGDSFPIFVLAHEVGHHVHTHFRDFKVNTRASENTADYLAGFYLGSAKASLPRVLADMCLLGESEIHGTVAERRAIVSQGFKAAQSKRSKISPGYFPSAGISVR